jgi:hypothetical protein
LAALVPLAASEPTGALRAPASHVRDACTHPQVLGDGALSQMRAQLAPSVRLVALLRNPSDRFYSAFNMGMNEKRSRNERLRYADFAARMDRMIECAPDCPAEPRVVSMFFNYGLYARHLRRYLAHFGREALLIECSEDFYSAPRDVVERVLAFANLPTQAAVRAAADRQASSTSFSTRGRLNSGQLWGGDGYTGHLQPKERAKLEAFYAPHNQELYALVGRDFGWERRSVLDKGDVETPQVQRLPTAGSVSRDGTADGTVGPSAAASSPGTWSSPLRPEL